MSPIIDSSSRAFRFYNFINNPIDTLVSTATSWFRYAAKEIPTIPKKLDGQVLSLLRFTPVQQAAIYNASGVIFTSAKTASAVVVDSVLPTASMLAPALICASAGSTGTALAYLASSYVTKIFIMVLGNKIDAKTSSSFVIVSDPRMVTIRENIRSAVVGAAYIGSALYLPTLTALGNFILFTPDCVSPLDYPRAREIQAKCLSASVASLGQQCVKECFYRDNQDWGLLSDETLLRTFAYMATGGLTINLSCRLVPHSYRSLITSAWISTNNNDIKDEMMNSLLYSSCGMLSYSAASGGVIGGTAALIATAAPVALAATNVEGIKVLKSRYSKDELDQAEEKAAKTEGYQSETILVHDALYDAGMPWVVIRLCLSYQRDRDI